MEPYAWRRDGSHYRLVYDPSLVAGVDGKLAAWEGAWVYAHTDCQLLLPPPSQGARARHVRPGQGWTVRLRAGTDAGQGEAVLGVAPRGRGLAVGRPPDPPGEAGRVQVWILKEGVPLALELREGSAGKQEWEVGVRWGPEARPGRPEGVVLAFDGAGRVPREVSLWLVDLMAGQQVLLRTRSAYRFVAGEGETERRFKVVAEVGRERPLQIVGLTAAPTRAGEVTVGFTLTRGPRCGWSWRR